MLTHDWLIFYDGVLAGIGASAVTVFLLLVMAGGSSGTSEDQ